MTLSIDRYRALVDAMPQLLWSTRGDGPCDYLSAQWVAYTGIPEDEQLGYRWLEQIHPDDRAATASGWSEAVALRGPADLDVRIRRYDGAYRWFKMRATPELSPDGTILRWNGTNTATPRPARNRRRGTRIRDRRKPTRPAHR